MSFSLLVLLVSLIVIVPVIFILIEKSRQQQVAHDMQHQHYITKKAKGELHKSRPELKVIDTLQAYVNRDELPQSFRYLLNNICDIYHHLNSVELSREKRFNINKLAGVRLPEILEAYLALEPNYAQNTIIDSVKKLTSYDITYGQMKTILSFMQRATEEGQGLIVNNILANRGYIDSVYEEFYQEGEQISDTAKSANTIEPKTAAFAEQGSLNDKSKLLDNTMHSKGMDYLRHCDALVNESLRAQSTINGPLTNRVNNLQLVKFNTVIGARNIIQLGKLVHVAEQTLDYADDALLLPNTTSLNVFDDILSHQIPNLIRQVINIRLDDEGIEIDSQSVSDLNKVLKSSNAIKFENNQQACIEDKITRIGQLLEACLNILKRADRYNKSGILTTDKIEQLIDEVNKQKEQAQNLIYDGFFNLH